MTEITIPVMMTTTLTIKVPSEVWHSMDEFQKRAKIEEEIHSMRRTIDREGGIHCGTSALYGTIDDWSGDVSEEETEAEH